MLNLKKILIVFLIVSAVVGSELNENKSENNGTEEARSEVEARRRHHLFSNHSHLWIAGLHALAIYWAIKIKIFVVVIAIGFAIFYGLKVWAGTKLLSAPVYAEPYPIIQETPYHAPYEHVVEYGGHGHHSGPEIYSSYPGPEPYSAWSSSNGPSAYSAPISSISSDPSDVIIDAEHHRRNSNTQKQKRDLRAHTETEPDWSDLVFTFLGVHSMDCRKRFVCEMEIKSQATGISRMAFKFLSENFLGQYRNVNDLPRSVRHCMQMYKECEFVNDFDDGEQVDLQDAADIASVDDNRVQQRIFRASARK